MASHPRWQQVGRNSAQVYERDLVPAMFAPWAPKLIELAAVQPGQRVLDVARGTGVVTRVAAARVGNAGRPWPGIMDSDVRIGSRGTMSFPRSDRVIFRKNPLQEVICQLRFPTILAISAETPSAFQERVRQAYPLYERVDENAALAPFLQQISLRLTGISVTHKFASEDSRRTMALNQDFVSITENEYGRWEDFQKEIRIAESTLRDIYKPAYYSRVGLRYQNVIDRGQLGLSNQRWNELISPYFAGLLGSNEVQGDVQELGSEALIQLNRVEGGRVRIRHGLARAQADPEPPYLIDADFFLEGRCTDERAFEVLDIFHQVAGDLFRWAITADLQRALDPDPVE